MRYFVWALRLIVFVAVLMFALKNTNPVQGQFLRRLHHARCPAHRRSMLHYFRGRRDFRPAVDRTRRHAAAGAKPCACARNWTVCRPR